VLKAAEVCPHCQRDLEHFPITLGHILRQRSSFRTLLV
jgi:hypothetical protein